LINVLINDTISKKLEVGMKIFKSLFCKN
jgi:hypothetical protein